MEERWRVKGVSCSQWPTCWQHFKTDNKLVDVTYVSARQAWKELMNGDGRAW
jgi:hypothetical protein